MIHGRLIVQRLEAQDYNRDGGLNDDGFKAAMLIGEIQMNEEELAEAFNLICEGEDLAYQDWVLRNYPSYREYFQLTITSRDLGRDTPQPDRISASATARDFPGDPSSIHETSMSLIREEVDKNKLASARNKIENYLKAKDMSLGVMFRVIDADSTGAMELPEFKNKIKGLHMNLDDEEVVAIFRSLDLNSSGAVTYAELVEQFSTINTEQIINRISNVLTSSKIQEEFYFDKYAGVDGTRSRMSKQEFSRMIRELYSKVTNLELAHVYKHFDRGNKGYILKEDFLSAFKHPVSQQTFALSIEDIVKPLATKARKFGVKLGPLFHKYDTDGNHRLSAEELRDALAKNKIVLSNEDVLALKEHFRIQYRTSEIKKEDFVALMEKKFERRVAEPEAKKALFDVKNKLAANHTTAHKFLMLHNPDSSELINIASFKMAIYTLKCLALHDIDNLTKYMDEKNEGFISVGTF